MRNWQKLTRLDRSLPRCRRLDPSYNIPHAPAATQAFEDDAEARRWLAEGQMNLWDLSPATRSRKRQESQRTLYHALRGLAPAQNLLVQESQPNLYPLTNSKSYPYGPGFQGTAYAVHHQILQKGVHVYDAFLSKRFSQGLRKNLYYNCINTTEKTWIYSKPYITDIHRKKLNRTQCRVK